MNSPDTRPSASLENDYFPAAIFCFPGRPLPMARRLAVGNWVIRNIRSFMLDNNFNEIPIPAIGNLTGSCEVTNSATAVDLGGKVAFANQTGQFILDQMITSGFPLVWCESETLRREWKVDERHLSSFKLVELEARDINLDELCSLQTRLLKHVASLISADLLGGRQVTRLDAMLSSDHPRMTYREVLKLLNSRGYAMPFGEDLHRDAEATLSRYCNNLPVHVTHFPAELKPFNSKRDPADNSVTLSAEYILPYAGETMDGAIRESNAQVMRENFLQSSLCDQLMETASGFATFKQGVSLPSGEPTDLENSISDCQSQVLAGYEKYFSLFENQEIKRGGFGTGVARLLQYMMGLESIKDAIINPLDRSSFNNSGNKNTQSHHRYGQKVE